MHLLKSLLRQSPLLYIFSKPLGFVNVDLGKDNCDLFQSPGLKINKHSEMKPWNSFDGLGVIGIIPPTTFTDMFFNFCLVLTGEFTHVLAFLFSYFYFVAYFKNKIKKSLK